MPSTTARSTRLNIVEKSLTDAIERLKEMPPSARVRELRLKAEGYLRVVAAWSVKPPTQERRTELLKLALELDVAAMALGRKGGGQTSEE